MKRFFVLLLCGWIATSATLAATSGTTGNCTWRLTGSSSSYTLTISPISGTNGRMADYGPENMPWYPGKNGIQSFYITTLVIESGVTYLGTYAFDNCSFTSITIPASVTTIGAYAFWYCSELSLITCNGTTPPTLPANAFTHGAGSISNIAIQVPTSAASTYRSTSPWSSARSINNSSSLSTPTSSCFSFTSSATYTGSSLNANVSAICSGMGSITAVYYNNSTTRPSAVGSYTIKINVAQGTSYSAISGLTLGTFTITAAPSSPSDQTSSLFTEPFESGSGTTLSNWTFANGSQTNKWHVGTATSYTGSRAAYISNNNSS